VKRGASDGAAAVAALLIAGVFDCPADGKKSGGE
jgi:hypothetical protein